MMKQVTSRHFISDDRKEYLEKAARDRNLSEAYLLRKIVQFVLRDKLILSILDDDDKPSEKTAPEKQTYHPPKNSTPKLPSVTKTAPSVLKHKPNALTGAFTRHKEKTKGELQRELEEAVRRTAELPVE